MECMRANKLKLNPNKLEILLMGPNLTLGNGIIQLISLKAHWEPF